MVLNEQEECDLCSSDDIGYSNAAGSNIFPGLEAKIRLCRRHAQIALHPDLWPRTNRDLWLDAGKELVKRENIGLEIVSAIRRMGVYKSEKTLSFRAIIILFKEVKMPQRWVARNTGEMHIIDPKEKDINPAVIKAYNAAFRKPNEEEKAKTLLGSASQQNPQLN